MQSRTGWESDTPDLYFATFNSPWGGKRYVSVEVLPEGGWDWVSWSADGRGQAMHGRAETQEQAMEAAEYSAALLAWAPKTDLSLWGRRVLHSGHELAM